MMVKEIPNNLFFANIRSIIDSGNSVELKVKGTSMHPTLLNGKHKVVLVPYQKQYLKVGVIALFACNGKHILHRLVSIRGTLLIFQGDNLPYAKEYVKEEDILAIAKYIITPAGRVIDCMKPGFYFKRRLWSPVYQSYSMLIRKMRNLYIKASDYRNQRIWNPK